MPTRRLPAPPIAQRGASNTSRAEVRAITRPPLRIALLAAALAAALALYAATGTHTRGRLVNGIGPSATPTQPACTPADAELLADCIFMLDAGLRRAGGAGLVRHLDAAQAANGFTLTVWRAYADANLIAIGYTLTAADTRAHPQLSHELHGPGAVALTDRAGQQYQALSTTANIGGGCPIHPCTLPLAGAVALYDAAPLPPDATQASLRLTVPAVEVAPAVGQGTPTTVPGAWSVDFTLPVVPARRALVGQTVNAAGIPLTLEQVVATPLETRLCVRGLIPWERTKSLPQPVIAGAGWPAPPQPPARTSRRADGVVVYRVDPAPAEQRAVWVVTFRADPRVALPGETPDGRSWTFRFVMPEATEAR